MKKYEKMSKSRGNGISVDEVVHGVYGVADGYEFRDASGATIAFLALGVWQNRGGDSMFYTAERFGRVPVFLCQIGNPAPCILLIDGVEREQHEKRWVALTQPIC